MRSLFTAVVGGCALAVFVLPVSAQPPGGGRGGMGMGMMGGPGQLIRNTGVQKELKMSDEQIKKAKDAVAQVREKHQEELQSLRDMDPEERREKGAPIMRAMAEETEKALTEVMKPEQMKRLKEISLQQRGSFAFTDSKVQEELKLTDDQKDKIKTINADAEKEMREIGQSMRGGGDPQEGLKKMVAARTEALDKAKALLTDDQKKTWESMTGSPFEVKWEMRRGGGGG